MVWNIEFYQMTHILSESSDLNPIEHVFHLLKGKTHQNKQPNKVAVKSW